MKPMLFAPLLVLGIFAIAFSQIQPAPKPGAEPIRAEQLVDEWFNRLNSLDDWFITMDGKEQPEEFVNSVTDLYAPDAIQFVGPNENQIGGATFSGKEAIHKWADDIARNYRDLAWRVISRTFEEKSASLFIVQPPWGAVSVAAELTLAYTDRDTDRRFMVPGAVFIDFKTDGKIRRVRLYFARDESEEIYQYKALANYTSPALESPFRRAVSYIKYAQ